MVGFSYVSIGQIWDPHCTLWIRRLNIHNQNFCEELSYLVYNCFCSRWQTFFSWHLNTGLKASRFWCSKSVPLDIRTDVNHLNSGNLRYSDPHCLSLSRMFCILSINCTLAWRILLCSLNSFPILRPNRDFFWSKKLAESNCVT